MPNYNFSADNATSSAIMLGLQTALKVTLNEFSAKCGDQARDGLAELESKVLKEIKGSTSEGMSYGDEASIISVALKFVEAVFEAAQNEIARKKTE